MQWQMLCKSKNVLPFFLGISQYCIFIGNLVGVQYELLHITTGYYVLLKVTISRVKEHQIVLYNTKLQLNCQTICIIGKWPKNIWKVFDLYNICHCNNGVLLTTAEERSGELLFGLVIRGASKCLFAGQYGIRLCYIERACLA